jgi:hypothetical protein
MLQPPLHYVFTIQCYSLHITFLQSYATALYYILQSNVTASILRPYNLGLQPLSYVLQSNVTTSKLSHHNLTITASILIFQLYITYLHLILQPLYDVPTIQFYSFYITSLQSKVTASIFRLYQLMLQPLYSVTVCIVCPAI